MARDHRCAAFTRSFSYATTERDQAISAFGNCGHRQDVTKCLLMTLFPLDNFVFDYNAKPLAMCFPTAASIL